MGQRLFFVFSLSFLPIACATYHGPTLPPDQQGMPNSSLDKVKESIQKKPDVQDDTVGTPKKNTVEVFLNPLPNSRKRLSDAGVVTLTN